MHFLYGHLCRCRSYLMNHVLDSMKICTSICHPPECGQLGHSNLLQSCLLFGMKMYRYHSLHSCSCPSVESCNIPKRLPSFYSQNTTTLEVCFKPRWQIVLTSRYWYSRSSMRVFCCSRRSFRCRNWFTRSDGADPHFRSAILTSDLTRLCSNSSNSSNALSCASWLLN